MKKGIPHVADRMLHNICNEKADEIAIQQLPGTASMQMEIRKLANHIIDYALEPATSYGAIEVIFAEKPWKGLNELYLQCPTSVTFSNFIPEKNDVDRDTLLVKHVIVVTKWSNALKIFKATIENDRIHLMLYTAVNT